MVTGLLALQILGVLALVCLHFTPGHVHVALVSISPLKPGRPIVALLNATK